jgi:hypothetical protein
MAVWAQRQEKPGSRPERRAQQGGKAGGAAGGRPGVPGLTTHVQMHPSLAEIVEEIADWDVPDGDVARGLTTNTLPSTAPYLIAQYRVPMRTERHFGSSGYPHRRLCLSQIKSGHSGDAIRRGPRGKEYALPS